MAEYLDYNGLQEYDKLIKQYVNDKEYKYSFTIDNWIKSQYSESYYLKIPKDDHKMDNPYVSHYYILQKGTFKEAIPFIKIRSNQTVTIYTIGVSSRDALSNGFLIIKNK